MSNGRPLYKLHISARDQGKRRSEQDAVVEIMLANRLETLEFDSYTQTYDFQIVEDHGGLQQTQLGREVGRVQVKQALLSPLQSSLSARLTGTSSIASTSSSPSLDEYGLLGGNGRLSMAAPTNIEYSIVYGDVNGNFAIDQRTGLITTAKIIDREQRSQYQLEVVGRRGLAYGKCLVHVSISDLNDNAPIFALDRDDEILLAENAPVGQEVYLSRARDRDSGNNSHVTYTLSHNPDMMFRVGPSTGVIYLQRPIRVAPGTLLHLELTATDGGKPALFSKHSITVIVNDVNDHTPAFNHTSYEISIPESTRVNQRFFSVAAHDIDTHRNALLSYTIIEGNNDHRFGIFPDGFLYVRDDLDRETRDYYALTVQCSDAGQPARSAVVPVVIHIIDENDNAPQFSNSTFTFMVAENEPADSFVGKLVATDKDIGRNAELIYSLFSTTIDFSIDPNNGFIRTRRSFNREDLIHRTTSATASNSAPISISAGAENFILFDAIVIDNGSPRLRDKVRVKVIVTDVNDNAPEFIRAPYKVQVSEGASVGAQLLRIYSNDVDEGLNGDVYYRIIDGNQAGHFMLDDATGQLSLTRQLDREHQSLYILVIMAQDAAIEGQQLNSTTTITVEVTDENDIAPLFDNDIIQEISVRETSAVGIELFHFRASDADLGVNSQISFSLTAGNRKETFHIDSQTGVLYLHKPLDYEDITSYQLNVTASDGGSPRLTTTVTFNVMVLDENDNAPSFPNTAIVRQIKEGIDLKTPIVTVAAEDPDFGANGKVTYAITRQQPEMADGRHFGINTQTGVIHTLREIDRESIDTFRLTVVATDQAQPPAKQLSAEKLVTVIVEDINDNAPVFVSLNAAILPLKHPYEVNGGSRVDSLNGMTIMRVQAIDVDSSTNGIVTYELVSGDRELFKLHRNTGVISLMRGIVEPKVRYQLVLKATDEAVQAERKSSETYITLITCSGPEINGPIFDRREQSGSVYENEPIGTSILTVSARLHSAEIEYYITNVTFIFTANSSISSKESRHRMSRTVPRLFDIDTKLGLLTTAKELDRETGADMYEIEVYAIALGDKPRTTKTKVSRALFKFSTIL